jgi:hypothetical protein
LTRPFRERCRESGIIGSIELGIPMPNKFAALALGASLLAATAASAADEQAALAPGKAAGVKEAALHAPLWVWVAGVGFVALGIGLAVSSGNGNSGGSSTSTHP